MDKYGQKKIGLKEEKRRKMTDKESPLKCSRSIRSSPHYTPPCVRDCNTKDPKYQIQNL